ncbi:MAG: menaquinol-cytochrome c reductase cytochrome b/c subunit [Gaiellales bacterium]|nr:menaquinol-cytochrome c reductase cytochrome b/c subunit [Gaiellales bacterium]
MATSARKVINRRVRYESELADQKKEGHPFFPFAMFHDVVVNLLVVLIIVAMTIVWHATAGPISADHPTGVNGWLGALYEEKANPAVVSTEPRPEWYFLFLFELLRIFKEPWQLIFATVIIPTVWMVLLVVWPFLDTGRDRRLSRRPVGVAFGLATPAILIALTIAGGEAPGATGASVTGKPEFDSLPAAQLVVDFGCTSCHDFGGGGPAIGPNLGNGAPNPDPTAIKNQIANGGGGMPAFKDQMTPEQIDEVTKFIVALGTGNPADAQ